MAKSVAIICPDRNIKLWPNRIEQAAMGGGKSAILQLARGWGRRGYRVTIAGAFTEENEYRRVRTVPLEDAKGHYDVLIFVTGSLGHFRVPGVEGIQGERTLFWMNAALRMEPPETHAIDYYIAPAQFMARRAIDDWGYPSKQVVVIRGEGVSRRRGLSFFASPRNSSSFIYASHPYKALDNAIAALESFQSSYPDLTLDVYGGPALYGDDQPALPPGDYPSWVKVCGLMPQAEIEKRMGRYGAMPYLAHCIDGFSLATSEALASGVLVIATAHGSNAELIRHGWNGFLVSIKDGQPDFDEAKDILGEYLSKPSAFNFIRRNATTTVSTWDEQAAQWEQLWSK